MGGLYGKTWERVVNVRTYFAASCGSSKGRHNEESERPGPPDREIPVPGATEAAVSSRAQWRFARVCERAHPDRGQPRVLPGWCAAGRLPAGGRHLRGTCPGQEQVVFPL